MGLNNYAGLSSSEDFFNSFFPFHCFPQFVIYHYDNSTILLFFFSLIILEWT